MFCLKCGEAIPDESKVCPKCEADLAENQNMQAVVYASQKSEAPVSAPPSEKKPFSKKLAGIFAAIAAMVFIAFMVISVQKSNLQKDIQKEWMDTDGTILKILEFDDDEVEYRLETGYLWMDTTLFTSDYKVVSGNKIKINRYRDDYETYTVKFNDKKTIMTITPAVTSTASSEIWYNLD